MADDLEDEFEIVRKVKHLSTRFQKGWNKMHPMSAKHREAMREAIQQEWDQQQKKGRSDQAEHEKQSEKKRKEQEAETQKSQQSQSKNKGHSH